MVDKNESPKSGVISAAVIGAGGVIVAAFITGVFYWMSAGGCESVTRIRSPSASNMQLAFEGIEAIPQRVNRKHREDSGNITFLGDQEISTYRLAIKNNGRTPLDITKGEYVVDSVELPIRTDQIGSTAAMFTLIDHADHIEAPMNVPAVGDTVTFPMNLSIAADARRRITVWFRGVDHNAPAFFRTNGRIRIYSGEAFITSGPIRLELHRDSQNMPKPLDRPGGRT